MKITYIGGPTALLEMGPIRLLTDPTFDPAGTEYPAHGYTLRKTAEPALEPQSVLPIDAVLLSHDHHPDNLDHAGRTILGSATSVVTTPEGAERLGGNAVGLVPWETMEIAGTGGRILQVTGTPARHGPPDGDRGPVVGFLLTWRDTPREAVYVSGDTVWFEELEEIARRFRVHVAVLFLGAARVQAVGPAHLTLTAAEAVKAAECFPDATIVPLHYEGWEHYSEPRREVQTILRAAGVDHRFQWPAAGVATEVGAPGSSP